MDFIESLCRDVCAMKGIDPDANGFAMTPETLARLGPTYKLWEYQRDVVEMIVRASTPMA